MRGSKCKNVRGGQSACSGDVKRRRDAPTQDTQPHMPRCTARGRHKLVYMQRGLKLYYLRCIHSLSFDYVSGMTETLSYLALWSCSGSSTRRVVDTLWQLLANNHSGPHSCRASQRSSLPFLPPRCCRGPSLFPRGSPCRCLLPASLLHAALVTNNVSR